MEYLLIPLSCILASSKILIQSRFARDKTRSPIDAIFFNGSIFAIGAILFVIFFDVKFTTPAIIAALISGIANLSYQMVYIYAFTCGPVSLTALVSSVSMVVPILLSAFIYGEALTPTRILGIIVTIASLYFTATKSGNDKIHLRWTIFAALTFLANCFASMTQKVYTASYANGDTSSYVVMQFVFSALISFVIYVVMRSRGNRCTYQINKSVIFTAASIGIILGGFHLAYTYAISVIDATLLLPLYNGGCTLLTTIGSSFLFKETLTKRQYTSIILGVVAICLMTM